MEPVAKLQTTTAPKQQLESSPKAVNQATDLVHELKDLKQEMRNALVGAAQMKGQQFDIQPEEKLGAFTSFNTSGPFPLDDFLKSGAAVSSSPYPSLRAPGPAAAGGGRGTGPDAPLVQRYTEAEATLQKVQQSRDYLETNLDAILRRHKDAEVVTFLEELTKDASATERLRIKKMVDDHIASMNVDLQREIMEEMLKIEDAQQKNIPPMVPERDTGSKVKSRPGFKAKGKVGSRIDSGLRKPVPSAPARKAVPGKPDLTKPISNKAKVTLPKKRAGPDTETYLTRVYGRSLYHGTRNAQRDPKVRYSGASPSSKLAHSPTRPTGNARQQRGDSAATSGVQKENYYFSPSGRGQQQVPTQSGVITTPVEGHLFPMAIPLRAPRQESVGPRGGRLPPAHFPPGPLPSGSVQSTPQAGDHAPFASTPLENHVTPRPQMSLREEDSVNPPGAAAESVPTKPDVQQQAISPIRQPSPRHHDDYSLSSETATTARQQQVAPTEPPAAAIQEGPDEQLAGYEQDFEEDEDEDTVTESWEEGGIALPGHKPRPVAPYHGPSFPPRAPALTPAASSDVLGSDLRRRDIVANKAMEWVEQELLARLLSEIAEQRALEEAMRRPPPVESVKARARSPDDSQCSDASSLVPSERQPLIVEAIGRDGLQMFVDAGMPVDDKLVSALVKEVLHEKMSTLTGQLTAADDDGPGRVPAAQQPAPRPRSRPHSPGKQAAADNRVPPPQTWSSPVPTPEVTPRSSPRLSPTRQRVSPPATPDLTPAASVAEELPPAPRHHVPPPPDPDSTDDSVPFEEYRPPRQPEPERTSPTFIPRHDVRTPSATPPPSPPPGGITPELSLEEEEPPALPAPPPIRVETRDTGVMVNIVKIVRAYEVDEDEEDMVIVQRNTKAQKHMIEEKPKRKPSPPPATKEPTPPPSPQPEESLQEEVHADQTPAQPIRVLPVEPPAPEPITTGTQTAQRTPSPSTVTSQDDSTATETMDDAISEGEWLLTLHSEGEVRPVPLFNAGMRGDDRGRAGGRHREVDDTLHDYDDFDLDHDGREQSTDFEPSEGEFLHQRGMPLDQDPMLSYLYQIQHQPMRVLEQQLRQSQMAAASGQPSQVDKSLGEVSFGQPHRVQVPAGPRHVIVQSGGQQGQQHQKYQQLQQQQPTSNQRKLSPSAQSASVGEAPSPGEVEGSSTSADSITDTQVDVSPPLSNQPPAHGMPVRENAHPATTRPEHPQTNGHGSNGVKGHADVTDEVPPSGMNSTQGDLNASPSVTMERAPRLTDARRSGMLGGPIMSTENFSRGNRRGGRPGGPRGRFTAGRPQTPDDSQSQGRVIQVRSSVESDLRDTLESVDGLRSTAGSDFRTMTPDQMNVDALLQSGQYMNTTLSTEGGSTTDFGRTGDLGTIRSTDFTHSAEQLNPARSDEFGTRSSGGPGTGVFGTTRSEDFGTRSGQFGSRYFGGEPGGGGSGAFGTQSSYGDLDHEGLMSGTFGRSGRLNYTTTELGQSGSEPNYRLGDTNGSVDLQQSGQYPDSLEGTGALGDTGSLGGTYGPGGSQPHTRQSLQVSVTIPSMAQSDTGSDVSASVEDVSEISLGK